MLRRLSRLLAPVARLEPLKPQIERSNPRHVLNSNFISTVKEVSDEQKQFTITNYETRIWVNHYLEAVFQRDLNQAFHILSKFKDKCRVNRNRSSFPRNVQLYISCLSTMVAQVASTSDGSQREFNEIKAAKEELDQLPPFIVQNALPSQVAQIRMQLVVALARNSDKTPKQHSLRRHAARNLALSYTQEHHFSRQHLENFVASGYPEALRSFKALWPDFGHDLDDHTACVDVKPYLDSSGSMSFSSLNDFIKSTRFQYHSDTRPMYQIFDSLDSDEKATFLDAYLKHNRARQLEVEHYCGALQQAFTPRHHNSAFQKFSTVHNQWLLQWHTTIVEALKTLDPVQNQSLSKFAFFYTTYPVEKLASLVISNMLSLTLASGLVGTLKMAKAISNSFKQSLRTDPKLKPIMKQVNHYLNQEDSIEFFCGMIKLVLEKCVLPRDSFLVRSVQGQSLFSAGYEKSSTDRSAFYKSGIITLNREILNLFQTYVDLLHGGSVLLPMLCPPDKWVSPTEGGYLEGLAPLVRSSDEKTTSKYINKAHTTGQLKSVYDVLTELGSLRWVINSKMLETYTEGLEIKEGFLLIPAPLPELKVRDIPEPKVSSYGTDDEYKEAMRAFTKQKQEAENEYFGLRGNRISYELINKVASSFDANGDVLYLPHNLDFRGRVYPAVSSLSHHNEDLIRSILMFWDAKPLGPDGFNWIKYQLANLYSKSKLDMNESIAFVDLNWSNIIDSASRPFNGDQWWTKGDNPWQSLALCKEIWLISEFEGPPAEYRSRIPVHQDGTCNGLQHYAALGGDKEAAKAVNLLPSEDRNDIYIKVLELVKSKILDDLKSDEKYRKDMAEISHPLLLRKLIKRTVMTTVYGVTYFGAARQIEENIDQFSKDTNAVVSSKYSTGQVATYIAGKVLLSITELFSGAQAIQDWLLRNCLRCVKSFSADDVRSLKNIDFFGLKHYQPMMWSSVSGFPVVQLYRYDVKKEIVTPLQKVMVLQKSRVSHMNVRKQLNAVAPNFIHSLDAIHLQMTCLRANQQGLNFAGVHDSFWTHACDVDTLNKIIREEFVRLHHSHIIPNLRDDMIYTNRSGMQVVWVNNSESPAFVNEIQRLRQEYSLKTSRKGKKFFSECLEIEIQNPEHVLVLVDRHKPRLWFQSRDSSAVAERYDEDTGEEQPVSTKTHTPVLVMVNILPEPPVGKLDIDQVLESKYFFS